MKLSRELEAQVIMKRKNTIRQMVDLAKEREIATIRQMVDLAKEREIANTRNDDVWDVRNELRNRVESQIEKETEKIITDKNESNVKMQGWKTQIRKDVLVLFLNKLFEKASFSSYTMQRMMDQYIQYGYFENNNCNNCELHDEVEYARESLYEREQQLSEAKDIITIKSETISNYKKRLRKTEEKLNELKKNSVVFSMDL
jgi:hypothetical protein